MPIFTIETPSGRKLDIEAADEAAAIRGAQDWEGRQPKGALDGLGTAAQQGFAGMVGGVGETLKQTGLPGGDTLKAIASRAAPERPVDTAVYKDGLHVENAPRFLAEQAAPTAAMIASGRLASRLPGVPAKVAGLLGAALAGGSMMFGNTAKDVAADRSGDPNAEPNSADKTRAALTTVPAALVGATGVLRFLPGAGKVTSTGLKGTGEAVKQLSLRTAENVASDAASNLVEQTGKTIGTEKGLRIDPDQVINAGIGGGLAAGALATPRALSDVRGAVRDRAFGGENAEATAQVANRLTQHAAEDGNKSLRNTRSAEEARVAVKDAITSELQSEITALKQRGAEITPDTQHAMERAVKGAATEADFKRLADAPGVSALARQAHVINMLSQRGTSSGGRFKGGISSRMERVVNPVRAGAVGLGSLIASGHFPAIGIYAPQALAALGGAYGAARVMDSFTGARSPVGQFANKFSNGQGVRPETVQPNPDDRRSITGPRIPPASPGPWGSPAAPEQLPDPRQLAAQVNALKVFREAAAKREKAEQQALVRNTMPALRALAAQKAPEAPPAPPAAPQPDPRQLVLQMQALANSRKASASRQPEVMPEPAPSKPVTPAAPEPTEVPADILQQAKVLMSSRAKMAKLRDDQEKANAKVAAAEAKAKAKDDKVAAKVATDEAKANAKAAKEAEKVMKAARAFTKIKKSNGKVNETKPEPKVFTPATDAELPFQFMDHGEAADAYFASRDKKPSDRERAAKIRGRVREEGMIQKIVSKAKGNDKETLRMVLEELHHNSSASYTTQMLDYYVTKLPKDIGDELRRAFSDDYIRRNKQPDKA
jgi:hypothetical protein